MVIALALVGVLGLVLPAAAQGLREEAVGLLSAIDQPGANPCEQLETLRALLSQVEAGDAEAFMPEEMAALRETGPVLESRCEAWRATDAAERARIEALLATCVQLAQARAFCRVLDECAEVSQLTPRMADFWRGAREGCPR